MVSRLEELSRGAALHIIFFELSDGAKPALPYKQLLTKVMRKETPCPQGLAIVTSFIITNPPCAAEERQLNANRNSFLQFM